MVSTRTRDYSAQNHRKVLKIAKKFARVLRAKVTALKKHATGVIVRLHDPELFNAVDYKNQWQITTMPLTQDTGPRMFIQTFEGGIRLIEGIPLVHL
jgi:hypothetical protein